MTGHRTNTDITRPLPTGREERTRRWPAPAPRRIGFGTLDVVAAIGLLGVIAVALTTTLSMQHRAAVRLAENRQAVRQAEVVLSDLRTGRPPGGPATAPAAPEGTATTTTTRIDGLPDTEAPAGRRWVRVEIRRGERTTALVGLVPAAAADAYGSAGKTGDGHPSGAAPPAQGGDR